MDTFFEDIYRILETVPEGKVVTYGRLAFLAGHPRAARQAGKAIAVCPDHLPWQRVVHSDGSISGGYFPEIRIALLEEEGVTFLPNGNVDMAKHLWSGENEQAIPE